MPVKDFIKSLNNDKVEGELVKTIFVSLVTSFILLGILFFVRLRYIENFIPKYGFFLFFAVLSYSLILLSVKHIRAYKEFSCMSGMMEGMMAGFMGGIMGGMTAIMMLNDNLRVAGAVVFMISGFILFGLNYMIYTETREMERKHKDNEFFTISWSFMLTAVTTWFMVFGPRSLLFQ